MTRKEQIETAAQNFFSFMEDAQHRGFLKKAFRDGAEWADANPIITDIYKSLDRAHHAEETVEALKDQLAQQGVDFGYAQSNLEAKLNTSYKDYKKLQSENVDLSIRLKIATEALEFCSVINMPSKPVQADLTMGKCHCKTEKGWEIKK